MYWFALMPAVAYAPEAYASTADAESPNSVSTPPVNCS